MAETYTNGVWHVKDGEEDAFVEAWREFASWGHTWPGCGTLRLVRDRHQPSRYMSFRPWGELRGPAGVEGRPRVLQERIGRVRQHTDEFTPSVFELVTTVE